MIVAVINNKGGTAKTTSSVNLAAGLARQGYKTLLVDLDSQASAALSLGMSREELNPGMSEAIMDGMPMEEVIRSRISAGLDIAPGGMDLANTDLNLADIPGREKRLNIQLQRVAGSYDWMVLDCPPSLSLLSVNALVASDYYLIPVKPEYLSMEGLAGLNQSVQRLKKGLRVAPSLLGILLTIVHPSSRAARQVMQRIRQEYGEYVFQDYVRQDVRLLEAPEAGRSIFDYAPRSNGAMAYTRTVKELLARSQQ